MFLQRRTDALQRFSRFDIFARCAFSAPADIFSFHAFDIVLNTPRDTWPAADDMALTTLPSRQPAARDLPVISAEINE
jgi:hypothetical protein